MKKKVSFVRELQEAVGNDRQVFEVANGAYAMHWMQGAPFTIIFPEELDTDEWGNIIDPLKVGRCGVGSPLVTESNLLYSPSNDFLLYWCVLEQESNEVCYLRLCEPKDASHIFAEYTHGELRGKALSAHDSGVCSDLRFYHDANDSKHICFLMPVGYIRLSYENDGVTYFAHGINAPEELAQYYQERSAAWRQMAQEKLGTWRVRVEQKAEAIQQAEEFKKSHKDELDILIARHEALRRDMSEFATTADLDFRQDATGLGKSKLSTVISPSCGWKINLDSKKFNYSEQGINELTQAICELESKAATLKANQEERRKRSKIMREISNYITENHVCVVTKGGNRTSRSVNYQYIRAEVDVDTVTIYNCNHHGIWKEEQFSLEEGCEPIHTHLQYVIAENNENWCKFRCKLEDLVHPVTH